MSANARSPAYDLMLKGERLCRVGDHAAGVDCFEQALQHGTEDLSILSVIYNQLGNAYIYLGNFSKAIEYYQHECILSQSTGDLLGEAKANNSLCSTFKMVGNFPEAILCSQQQLEIARKLSNKAMEAQALYNMGNAYHVKAKQKCHPAAGSEKQDPDVTADLNIALVCYGQNLDLVRELNDRAAQGKVCGSIGNTHYLLGNCNEAVKFHTERLAIAKEFGDQAAQRRAFTNLGNSHIVLGDYEQAAQFYLQTLSISRQLNDSVFEAQACYSLGSTYTLLSDFDRAVEYHLRHKQLAKELNDRVGMARACWLLSNSYSSLGNYTKAIEYSEQQLLFSTEIGDEPGIITAQRTLKELTVLLHKHKPDKPRVRRRSMENMQLLTLTPDRAAANVPTTSTAVNNSSNDVNRIIFDNNRKSFHSGVDLRNGNTNPNRSNRPYSCNGVDNVANQRSDNIASPSPDKFFDLITRLQGRRMDDQRVEMRDEAEGNDVDGADGNDVVAAEPGPNRLDEQIAAVANNDDQDNYERMNFMISMLARSQSKRLNDQRVSLNSLPGVRVASGSGDPEAQGSPPVPVDNRNNEEIENNVFELDDNFLENLMRCQGTRLNDQRTAAPDVDAYVAPTIPDEDFIALIVRMQSSRIDDQRCQFDPDK